jgi:antitoxin PrlF
VSGSAAGKPAGSQPVSVRARLRPKSQLTLPEEIRRALRVNEGDEVEFRVAENGTVTVRGYTSIPTDHAWLYAQHQSARQATDGEVADRPAPAHESTDGPFIDPDGPGSS